ncbi:hypothetical protein C2W63_02955 [Bacillus velezensis]|nr:hypothetical protein C2W63_02955 [Bacillus velezensis]
MIVFTNEKKVHIDSFLTVKIKSAYFKRDIFENLIELSVFLLI